MKKTLLTIMCLAFVLGLNAIIVTAVLNAKSIPTSVDAQINQKNVHMKATIPENNCNSCLKFYKDSEEDKLKCFKMYCE